MFSSFLKDLSILKKFLFINLIFFTIIGLFTFAYLKNVQPNLIKKKSSNHIEIINNTIDNLIRLDVSFDMRNDSEARAIIHFLKTRKGTESFCLSSECIPDIYADSTNYNKRFICLSFTSNFNFSENHSIKASFQEINN